MAPGDQEEGSCDSSSRKAYWQDIADDLEAGTESEYVVNSEDGNACFCNSLSGCNRSARDDIKSAAVSHQVAIVTIFLSLYIGFI